MKIAMLSPVAWPTPPKGYGPWEQVASNIAEGLVARGHDVTLFATKDSKTAGTLHAICPHAYEEDKSINPDVWMPMHIAEAFEHADEFDLIHNHCDFRALVFARLVNTPVVTTIHGFSSPSIYPAYEKYNRDTWYVSISDSDRYDKLVYAATVYNGIDLAQFTFRDTPGSPGSPDAPGADLLFIGRIHYEKGAAEAIQIAKQSGKRLIIAGFVQQEDYFKEHVEPYIDGEQIKFIGPVDAAKRDALMGNALAVLHPVMEPERFGLIMTESMACGTPVIAFDKGSPREVVRHGETGFVVEDVPAAVEAVGKIHEIDRRACRAHVEQHFTIDQMAEGYLRVYERMLKEHASGGKRPR
jgi:glycosyltransferase involved in cell wall biosynthesis